MTPKTYQRRAVRSTRPDSERFFTLMLVLSHRTFRWSVARRTVKWAAGIIVGVYLISMLGSGYGLWATKRLMSFSALQRETMDQQRQLRESQEQAQTLEQEIITLQEQMQEIMRHLDPKGTPTLQPVPTKPEGERGAPGKIGRLQQDLEQARQQAQAIRARMEPVFRTWNHTPSIPPTAGYISSPFGLRLTPFTRSNDAGSGPVSYHKGLDITNSEGTPVQATAAGTVTFSGWQPLYGLCILIRHSDELETLYAHLQRCLIGVGTEVNRGDLIGAMGRTGNATGVHLHYEVRRWGNPVNPAPYLKLQRQFLAKNRSIFPFRG